jgi:hypothetical protein
MGMIPKTLHFVWGYKPGDTFGLVERLAIQSAAHHNPDWEVILWTPRTPTSDQYAVLCDRVPRLQQRHAPEIATWQGRPLEKYQHRADILRHTVLYALGGAYLDLDTVTLEPFPEGWLSEQYVAALEYRRDGSPIGLCNATFLSAPHSRFGWKILSEYQQFDPSIHGYAEFAVMRPYDWAREMPQDVRVVRWELLGPMHWDCHSYFSRIGAADGVVVAHLWRTNHNDDMLRALTETGLRSANHTYAQAVRALL